MITFDDLSPSIIGLLLISSRLAINIIVHINFDYQMNVNTLYEGVPTR